MTKTLFPIKKNRFQSFFLYFFVFIAIAYNLGATDFLTEDNAKKNLLLITIDTLRADKLSCYGGKESLTPNIDSLAERGALFSRAFANTSTTLPSHTNIFLGTTPLYHGVHENLNFKVNDELLTLAEHLKNHGYSTGAFVGAYPLDSRFGLSQGFDIYDDNFSRAFSLDPSSIERKAEAVLEGALDWLQGQNTNWFLWLHFWDPHIPYDPPEPFKTLYKENPYIGEIAYVDQILGELIDFIQENNLLGNTVVVFTADHGESLGQHGEKTHGYFAYNSTIWIPLIILSPEGKCTRVDQLVSHIDIFPTVCDLLGLEKPSFLQGISLYPALIGQNLPERPIYFESLYPYYSKGWAPIKGFIQKNRKFIDSPIPELYELDKDFDELKNIATDKKTANYRQILEKIIANLTSSKIIDSKQSVDLKVLEKLKSLGYISNIRVKHKENYSPRDDVKILLPYIHRTTDAFDLYQHGAEDEGIKLLLKIINERKDIDTAYMRLADIYRETGQTEEAVKILEEGFLALPSNYEIFLDYIKTLTQAGHYDKAINLFEKTSFRETELDPEAWNNIGITYAKKGDFKSAIQAFEHGIFLDYRDPEIYNNLGNTYYSFGLQTKNPHIFQECFEYYKKAIEIDPNYSTPYFGLGQAYQQMERISDAIYCWEKALEINPEFQLAHRTLALAYLSIGKKARAYELLKDYKKRYYNLMSANEREKFDVLMKECLNK